MHSTSAAAEFVVLVLFLLCIKLKCRCLMAATVGQSANGWRRRNIEASHMLLSQNCNERWLISSPMLATCCWRLSHRYVARACNLVGCARWSDIPTPLTPADAHNTVTAEPNTLTKCRTAVRFASFIIAACASAALATSAIRRNDVVLGCYRLDGFSSFGSCVVVVVAAVDVVV